MKKHYWLPLASLICGVAAWLLRLMQNKTGFESSTGLSSPGNLFAQLFPLLLLISAVLVIILARSIPSKDDVSFPADFSTQNTALFILPTMGVLLLGLSGMVEALSIVSPDMFPAGSPYASQLRLIFAATALIPALALLSALSACRQRGSSEGLSPLSRIAPATLLLIPPICLVIRLVLAYRIHSINPVLQAYYPELLALVFTTLALYRLSSFAFEAGRPRRFSVYAALGVILSCAVLADGGSPSDLLLYAGTALTLLGFLLLHLKPRQSP